MGILTNFGQVGAEGISIISKPQELSLDVSHEASGYVGEVIPITVKVGNMDARKLKMSLSALIHLGDEADSTYQRVLLDLQLTFKLLQLPLGSRSRKVS